MSCLRFTTTLDCLDTGFLPEDTLDQLPLPSPLGATRLGGIDLCKLRSKELIIKPGRSHRYQVPASSPPYWHCATT